MNPEIDEISRALTIAEANIQTALKKELAALHAKGISLGEDDVSIVFNSHAGAPLEAEVSISLVVQGRKPHA